MASFRHHPDGWIYIDGDCYPLTWFQQQEPGYSLPGSAIAREYIPNVRNSFYSNDSQWGGELPWTAGDQYLAKAAQYRTTWQAANVPTPTPGTGIQPNWVQFRAQVSMHSAYFRLVMGHSQNGVLNDLLVPLLWGVGTAPALLPEVAAVWNAMESNVALNSIEILQLNTIAIACNIPLLLNAQGQMIVQT